MTIEAKHRAICLPFPLSPKENFIVLIEFKQLLSFARMYVLYVSYFFLSDIILVFIQNIVSNKQRIKELFNFSF